MEAQFIRQEERIGYDASINNEVSGAAMCTECTKRQSIQSCTCEPIKYLCSFCARNHWRIMHEIIQVEHNFLSAGKYFPHPIIIDREYQSIQRILENALSLCADTKPLFDFIKSQNSTKSKRGKVVAISNQINELNEIMRKLEKYNNIATDIYFNSVKQNLYILKDFCSIIKDISTLQFPINSEQINFAENIIRKAENMIFSIDIKLGDFSRIRFNTDWFDNLDLETIMTILRTLLIMKNQFNHEFLTVKVNELINLLNNGEKIDQFQQMIIDGMVKKITNQDPVFNDKFFGKLLRRSKGDPSNISKRMLVISFLWLNFERIPFDEEFCTRIGFFEIWETNDHINDVHVQMLQAWHYMKNGSYTDAVNLLNRCMYHLYESTNEDYPLFIECMQWLAECYSHYDNYLPYSLKLLEKVLEIKIKNLEWYDRELVRQIVENINNLLKKLNLI